MSSKTDKDTVAIHVTLRRDLYEKLVLYTMKKYGSPMRKIRLALNEILEKFFREQGEGH